MNQTINKKNEKKQTFSSVFLTLTLTHHKNKWNSSSIMSNLVHFCMSAFSNIYTNDISERQKGHDFSSMNDYDMHIYTSHKAFVWL